MSAAAASLASVALVSLISLAGLATLSMQEARVRRLTTVFVSFAVGALLGDAFLHLIPETFGDDGPGGSTVAPSLLVLGGILLFFVVEKLLRHRHGVLHRHHHGPDAAARPELAAVNVAGDVMHNFIDGVLIGASYQVSPTLGVATTIAVLLHEIPQEFGDFGVLVHSGLSVRKAVLANLGSASVAFVGAAVALAIGATARESIVFLIPITAGGFIYLAAADLIPELQHDRSLMALLVQTLSISLGIAVMALLTLIE